MKKFIAVLGLVASSSSMAALDAQERDVWQTCAGLHDIVVIAGVDHILDVSGFEDMHNLYLESANPVQVRKFEKERETSFRQYEGNWKAALEHHTREVGLTESQTAISFVGHILFSKNGIFIKRWNECF